MSINPKDGPHSKSINLTDGQTVTYHIIPFDKNGVCKGPETRAYLLEAARTGDFTDIVVFSHGWNNDWSTATKRYEDFIKGHLEMRKANQLALPEGYKPLLIGVFWPSTALVFGKNERGPRIAALESEVELSLADAAVVQTLEEIAMLAEDFNAEDTARLYGFAQKETLDRDEALELAKILKPIYAAPDDELGDDKLVAAEDLVDLWSMAQESPEMYGTEFVDRLWGKIDPRKVLRLATVYKMKDRAGIVGAVGVGSLLRDLLEVCDARVHLIGHSYGAKVVLSAVAAKVLPRPVNSILLLQAAVSHLCFADEVPGTQRAGGYRSVLQRVKQPILSTFSSHDSALTTYYHWALKRDKDLGEPMDLFKSESESEQLSPYAALGGFGPRASGEQLIDIHAVNVPYHLDPSVPIYGLRGDTAIASHGDISNQVTWWAFYSLMANSKDM